ncbi:hypothetical protein AALP_AA8G015500 [Arabis alpina]|uniref:Uncharacterized protein n=1 Tax=Arabis alpina TaxID=50452 RepID=A0A087G4B4_ARAAL|nr:hypothetical protein AALP_AA8G015500 [Arabis alpina]
MASLTKFQYYNQTIHLPLHNHSTFQSKSISYQILQKPSRSIKAFSSSSNPEPSFLKSTFVTLTTTAALFSASLHLSVKPATATTPITPPPSSSTAANLVSDEEASLENHLITNQNDVEALQSLMKLKFQTKKFEEALSILNRLIETEPEKQEWRILKAQVQSHNGDFDSAAKSFEEILTNDPFRIEAYHGLVMVYSDSESKLLELEVRINEAIEKCKKEDKGFREFMLLIAQIKVIEGKPSEAIRVYQELVKDEPSDFRPYLCQGLIYTLMKKKDEAEKQFEEFRRLVPENHPYKEYFDANVLDFNKLFAKNR